jgi:hypothetical protein
MVPEVTSGKWSLWATHPHRLGGIAEVFAIEATAEARASHLRRMGYVVKTFQSRPDYSQRGMPGAMAAAHPALLRHR